MIEPRATDHIVEMTTLIDRLVTAGHAYVAEDHVLFDVPSMPITAPCRAAPSTRWRPGPGRRGALQALAPRFRAVEALEAR